MLYRLHVIFFALLMVLSGAVLAQPDNEPLPDLPLTDTSQEVELPDSVTAHVDTALFSYGDDTAQLVNVVSKKKERRLELPKGATTIVSDTSLTSRIFIYTINRSTNEVQLGELDTSILFYRTDYPFFRQDVGAIYLGNLGSPAIYYSYFKRNNDYDFIFQQPYESYFFTPSNATFYNTTTPYTLLFYNWAGSQSQMEDQLRVLHAQNVVNKFSFVLEYNAMGTKGQYQRQHTKSKSLNFGASYLGNYYKANIGYIFNDVEAQESGGIGEDWLITDTVVDTYEHTIRLRNAKNVLKNSRFYLTHSLDIPLIYFGNDSVINNVLMARFGHSLEYSTYSKVYTDQPDTMYYANNYFNHKATRDSLGLRSFDNRLFFQLRPLRAYIFESLTAGVGYKSMQSHMFNPDMYLTGSVSEQLHTTYAYAKASAWYKQYFKWNAFFNINLSGYKSGDTKLGGDMTLSIYPTPKGIHLTAGVSIAGYTPDMFLQNYSTNHYRWANSFNRTIENRLGGTLSIPDLHAELGLNYSLISNYIYFAGEATYFDIADHKHRFDFDRYNVAPKQYGKALNVIAFTVNHNFDAAGFHFNHRLLFQASDNQDIISLPAVAVSASYYYECDLVKRVLRMQLGVDIQYATPFNGYGYNPSVGMFHTTQKQQGGHLWTDAFIAFRWKRATPFFKYEHAGQNLIDGNTAYFSAVHYPRNARVLKMGLSWKFFD